MIGIYCLKNKINNKKYIGQSINIEKRFLEHFNNSKNPNANGYNSKFYRAIRKYGIHNFEFSIIEELSLDKLNERETFWIQYYDSYKNGYNSTEDANNVTQNGEEHPMAKLNNQDVLEIKYLLKNTNKLQSEIANSFNVTQSEISNINTGKKWSNLGDYKYPIRENIKRTGENSSRAIMTDEEVLGIRKRYVNELGKNIYEDYKDRCSYTTFERILRGVTYTNVPIYYKKKKQWSK
jgi:group I intron endonuclease